MPKRKHNSEDNFKYLASKIKKLEKQLKVTKRNRQVRSDSSTSRSTSRSSSSSASSRDSSPTAPPYSPLSEQGHNEVPPAATTQETPALLSPAPEASAPVPAVAASVGDLQEQVNTPNKDITVATEPPSNKEPGLDPDLLDILGTDPSQVEEYGPNINDELASRLNYIATHGIDKEIRKELLKKYLTPSNCKTLSGPILNPEIKAATPEYVVKRDKSIEINQKQIAAAITCVGRIISTQLTNSERDKELLKNLMDVSRILCDVQFLQSNSRRNYALTSLKKDLKEQLSNTKIDGFLFGQDLSDTLKTAKAVSKSSTDLKADSYKKAKSNRHLNRKAGPGGRKAAPGPQRQHQQPPYTTRPSTSYQPPPPLPSQTSRMRGQSSTTSSGPPRQTKRR